MRASQEIRKEIEETLLSLDIIKSQLQEAKAHCAETGKYSDSGWFRRATFAAKLQGKKIQKLNAELSQSLKSEKQERIKLSEERRKVFERQFFYNANALLPPDLYQLVLDKTLADVPALEKLDAENMDEPA